MSLSLPGKVLKLFCCCLEEDTTTFFLKLGDDYFNVTKPMCFSPCAGQSQIFRQQLRRDFQNCNLRIYSRYHFGQVCPDLDKDNMHSIVVSLSAETLICQEMTGKWSSNNNI